jgi:hypothetical protein
MCRLSFINVVCDILKSICGLYKYMLYLAHGKTKKEKEKMKKQRRPGHLALGEGYLKTGEGVFPECLGVWHSGKCV